MPQNIDDLDTLIWQWCQQEGSCDGKKKNLVRHVFAQ